MFSSLDAAEEWIKRHALSGTITLYRVDVGAYGWEIANGYFKPSKPHRLINNHLLGRSLEIPSPLASESIVQTQVICLRRNGPGA